LTKKNRSAWKKTLVGALVTRCKNLLP